MSILLGGPRQGPPRRRDRLEIALHVLRILRELGPLRKTRLMQLANLNTRSFGDHVEGFLVGRGLVEKRSGLYAATPYGTSVYNVLRMLEAMGVFNQATAAPTPPPGTEIAATVNAALEEEHQGFRAYRLPCGNLLILVSSIRSPTARLSLARTLAPILTGTKAVVVAPDTPQEIEITIGGQTAAYIVPPNTATKTIRQLCPSTAAHG